MSKIIWSKIDEAPALATYSLLPIVNAFTKAAGVEVVLSDISLAGRVLAVMGLAEDELSKLGELCVKPEANIINLPNISASAGQLKDCISELQGQGYDIPNYPENAQTEEEKAIAAKYATCLGSAVNPVLREGNSDRRAAVAVKNFAKKNPHKLRAFAGDSKAYVAHMEGKGDFFSHEKSVTLDKDQKVTIALNGKELTSIKCVASEVLDGTFMSISALRTFYKQTIEDAKAKNLIWSLHLKATMMKISDPIMFGHAFEIFFADVFAKYADIFKEVGVNPNMGMSDLEKKIKGHAKEAEIKAAFQAVVNADAPKIAMVGRAWTSFLLQNQREHREDSTLSAVIRLEDEDHVLDGDDENECPENQRENAVDILDGRGDSVFRAEALAQRIQRARANISVHDAEGAEGENRESLPSGIRLNVARFRRPVLRRHARRHRRRPW